MKIETKFNIGDEAFVLSGDKIHTVNIKSIHIEVEEYGQFRTEQINIVYNVGIHPVHKSNTPTFCEDYLFKTKQELLESL